MKTTGKINTSLLISPRVKQSNQQTAQIIPSAPRQSVTTVKSDCSSYAHPICNTATNPRSAIGGKAESSAMEYEPVQIHPHHSPNPSKQETFTVICHSHRVRTVVTAKAAVVRKWVHKIRYHHRHQLRHGRMVVGLGVQWVPGRNAPATLQLCVGHHCLIFQLTRAAHSPAVLRRFLSEPSVKFVGVWNYKDASMLRESKHRLHISQLVDVRDVASELRGCSRGASMERLAAKILGMDGVEKKEWVGRSDWDETWLSEEQVGYACVDAFLCFLMAKALRVWNWSED
ncbi:hypothetical protein Salat_2634600 [Sesamum alatum]|uniref:3'-5' exonuclease domain-containing protein n=1 Tax=Sesamum alatum TaxID=300844 RepID=A0AAE1XPS4_9LAMI|nr:hypothetical protein Salat_2634600 [Sesamum alatum]